MKDIPLPPEGRASMKGTFPDNPLEGGVGYFDTTYGEEVTREQYENNTRQDGNLYTPTRSFLTNMFIPESECNFHLVPQHTPQEVLKMQVEKLTPKDGDTLVLKVAVTSTPDDMELVLDELDKIMKEMDVDVHAIIIREDESLECLDEKEMEKRGWVKKREYKGREFL